MAGIYVHIPYCHSKCAYCDFYSTPKGPDRRKFVESLTREWKMRRHESGHETVRTISLGGGTPSILSAEELSAITAPLPKENIEEFTIEANPEDVNRDLVRNIISLGINRVSIGVQSLHDSELHAVRRRHTAQEALDAIRTLHEVGITNVSADLIYGLPGQTLSTWRDSLERLIGSGITHLSAYALSYEPGTRLYAMLQAGKITEAPQELSEEMYMTLCATASAAGFTHYEISNFALPGMHSRHNSSYWDYTPYLGLGPGAHSFDGMVRRVNPSRLPAYIEAMTVGTTFYETEEETLTDRINDAIITGLRTLKGLRLDTIHGLGGQRAVDELQRNAMQFIRSGKVTVSDNTLRIPERYWLVSDAILRELLID